MVICPCFLKKSLREFEKAIYISQNGGAFNFTHLSGWLVQDVMANVESWPLWAQQGVVWLLYYI